MSMKKMKKRFLKTGESLLVRLLFTKKRRKSFKKARKERARQMKAGTGVLPVLAKISDVPEGMSRAAGIRANVKETVKESRDKAARTVSKKMKRKLAASAVKLTRSVMRQIQAL